MQIKKINSFSTSLYSFFDKFEYDRYREKELMDSTLHKLKKSEVVIKKALSI